MTEFCYPESQEWEEGAKIFMNTMNKEHSKMGSELHTDKAVKFDLNNHSSVSKWEREAKI